VGLGLREQVKTCLQISAKGLNLANYAERRHGDEMPPKQKEQSHE
jgi:hypothetical protein